MNRYAGIVLVGLLLATVSVSLGCKKNPPMFTVPWIDSFEEGAARARQQNRLIILQFYGRGQAASHHLFQTLYAEDKVVQKLLDYVCIRMEAQEDPRPAEMFGVRPIEVPQTRILLPDGRELFRLLHVTRSGQFLNELKRAEGTARNNYGWTGPVLPMGGPMIGD